MLVMWYPPKGHHIECEAMTIEQTWIHGFTVQWPWVISSVKVDTIG